MNSYMWAAVRLGKRRRRLQTHHPEFGSAEDSHDLRSGAQISNLKKTRDHEIHGLDGQVVIGAAIPCWITELPLNSAQKCMCSVIRFCVLAESVQNI